MTSIDDARSETGPYLTSTGTCSSGHRSTCSQRQRARPCSARRPERSARRPGQRCGSKEDFILLFALAAAGYRVSHSTSRAYGSVDAGPNLDLPRDHYDYRLFIDDLIAILEDGQACPCSAIAAGLVASLLVERPSSSPA
jgi:hypothetical protein